METRLTRITALVVFFSLCSKLHTQAQELDVCVRNDGSPSSLFRFVISESSQRDTVIGNLSFEGYAGNSTDPNIRLSLSEGFNDNRFVYIDDELKALRLIDMIDVDTSPIRIRQLRVEVGCLPLTTGDARELTYTVFVEVTDENDNAPQFIGAPYQFELSELAVPQTVVYSGVEAMDIDAASNGQILYSVQHNPNDPESSEYFSFLSSGIPALTLLRQLDYETKTSWEILVEARDSGTVPNRNSTTITVSILDGDDQGPVFLPCPSNDTGAGCEPFNYLTNITEKMVFVGPITFWPGPISAEDGDQGVINKSQIHYSFGEGEPSNYADYLAIDPVSGNVTLLQPVKHSEIQEFRIIVIATEGDSSGALSTTTKVIITMNEINLHTPQFSSDSVVAYVTEGVGTGSPVYTTLALDVPLVLTATDPDLGEDEVFRVSYMLNDPSGAFILASSNDSHARIVTNAIIDRETVDSYTLKLMAVESLTTAQFVSPPITVNITVLDINDNPPVFQPNEYSSAPNRYSAVIRQNLTAGSVIMQLEVSDVDTTPRVANYTYHLDTLSHFAPPEGTPFVEMSQNTVVKIVLKRDASLIPKGDYVLSLQAADVDNRFILSVQVMIDVRVIGVDDTRGPVFDLELYEAFASEGTLVNSLITEVTARSLDNLPILYSLSSEEELFTIDRLQGKIRLKQSLDRETMEEHVITVIAESGGKSAMTNILVKVVDVNDNSPQLNASVPSVFLIVEGLTDHLIGRISAYDIDEPGTLNSAVTYSLESEYFTIDTDTGALSTTSVPREVNWIERVELEVTLRDKGTPQMSAVATVAVIIQDPDNYQPIFEYPGYEVKIPENQAVMDFLQLKVLDRNISDMHQFSLLQGDASLTHVNTTSGTLSLHRALNFEGQKSYSLRVGVIDGSLHTDTTNITITVTDENDNAPIFNQSVYDGTYEVYPPSPNGTVVVQGIGAFDMDEPGSMNSFISYSLLSPEGFFQLVDIFTPVVVTANQLNVTQDIFTLTVVAVDHGTPLLSSTAKVVIRPRLIQPVFDERTKVTSLNEGMPSNSLVTEVKARSNIGDVVMYSIISGNAGDVFSVRSVNNIGNIYTTKELDREIRSSYTLQILAEIESSREQTGIRKRRAFDPSIIQVMIEVGDVNDNPPTFEQETYYAGVSLTANRGSYVTVVRASDLDAEPGEILYSLELISNNQSKFGILQRTGLVFTTDTFVSEESEGTFMLMVSSEDRSTNRLQAASAMLLISVINSTNRIVISLNLTTEMVEGHRDSLEEELSMLFSAHAFVEDVSQRRTGKGYQQFDPSSADIAIYVLEDVTARPWSNNQTLKKLQERRDRLDAIFFSLMPTGRILEIRKPSELERGLVVVTQGHPPEGVLLLILAVVIFLLTVLACIIILISWKKKEREREENRMYLPMQYSTFNPYKQSTEDLEISNPVFFEGHDNMSIRTEPTSQVELFPNGGKSYLKEKEIQEYSIELGPEDDEATEVANRVIHSGTLERSEQNGSVVSLQESPAKPLRPIPVSYQHSTSQEPLLEPDSPLSEDSDFSDDTPLPPPPDFSLPNVPDQPSRRAPSPPGRPTAQPPSPPSRDYSSEGTLPADTVLPNYETFDNPGLDISDEQDGASSPEAPVTSDDMEPLAPSTPSEGGGTDTIKKMIRRASRKGSLLLKESSKKPASGHYDPKTPQGHVDTDDLHVALIRMSQSQDDLNKIGDSPPMSTFKQPEGTAPPQREAIANNYVSMITPAPFRSPDRDPVPLVGDIIVDPDDPVEPSISVNDNLREYEELQAAASEFDEMESEVDSIHSTKL